MQKIFKFITIIGLLLLSALFSKDLENLVIHDENEAILKNTAFTQEEQNYISNNQMVRFTGDPNWLPFEAFTENGTYIGIVADYLNVIEQKINIKFEKVVPKDWTNALNIAMSANADVISGDASDDILNQNFNPIASYIQNPIVIIMKHENEFINDLYELEDKKIAIIKDYGYTADIYANYPDIKFIEVDNIQEALFGIEAGKYDVSLASLSVASYFISEMGLSDITIVGKTDIIMRVTLFVNKNKPLLHSILNKTMKSLTHKEHQAILQHWNNPKYAKVIDYDLLIKSTVVFVFILLLFFYRQHLLKKNNKQLQESQDKLKIASIKLQASHDLLGKLSENVPGAIFQYKHFSDGRGSFPYASSGISDIYEVEPEDVFEDAKSAFDVIHPDDLERIVSSIGSSAEDLSDWSIEYRVNLPKKGLRWLEGTSKPEKLKDGSIVWHGYIQDITDRKNTENEILEQKNVLNNQHQLLNNILDRTDDIMLVTDFKDVTFSNNKFKEFIEIEHTDVFNISSNHNIFNRLVSAKGYLHKGLLEDNEDFFSLIQRTPPEDRLISILNIDNDAKAFKISISKTTNIQEYLVTLSDITEMKEQLVTIARKAYRDGLTGVYNRNKFDEVFEEELKNIQRYKTPMSIAIIDIDKFKNFNDTHGHLIGDEVLIIMAQAMQNNVRETDTFARWGGEEFVILFKNTSIESAKEVSGKLKDKIEENEHSTAGKITASFGVTEYKDGDTIKSIFRRCDEALYIAKANGRNRVEVL